MDTRYLTAPTNQNLPNLPGDYGLPFIGKTFSMFADPIGTFDHHFQQYGPISRIGITGQKVVLLLGPDYLQRLLLDPEREFSTRKGWDIFMADFFAGGLLMRDFEEHRQHRRIMQTAFKSEQMRVYADVIAAIVQRTVREWRTSGHILFYPEIKKLLLRIAFDVFCKVDGEDNDEDNINRAFIDMMEGAMGIVRKDWPGLLYRRGMNGRRYLEQYFRKLVHKKRNGQDQDIFSHFCRERQENGEFFSEQEIAEHMVFLMLAAHDTTTSAITMAGFYLAQNTDLRQQLYAEQQALPTDASPYDAAHTRMPLLYNVLQETLRLHPPVANIFRRTVRDVDIDGVHIPPHTMLSAPPQYIQQMAPWWTRGGEFWPARFSDSIAEHRKHPFMWAAFGGGAHKCIGMHFAELLFTLTFAELLRHCDFSLTKPAANIAWFPFSKPSDDLPLTLSVR